MSNPVSLPPNLTRFAWLSIAAALATITLKLVAWKLTGSVGLLSDALESLVNLAGALMALAMLTISSRPADKNHPFGHDKFEYFSSGVEGSLILVAAVAIAWTAVERILSPHPLEQVGVGLVVSVVASLINLGVALVLVRAGKRHQSITLEAGGKHLLTDVWTSGGVVLGVGLVEITGWQVLDPVVAILVAVNIVRVGVGIVHASVMGLSDVAIPESDQELIRQKLAPWVKDGVSYHALRTRQAAGRQFVSFHLWVPGAWTVRQGHDVAEAMAVGIREVLPRAQVISHLEPEGDLDVGEDNFDPPL